MDKEVKKPLHFVLVHGAGHGAWCWYKLRCLLQNHGHKVTALDLIGAGIDITDPATISTFEDHNKPLLEFMSSLPELEKVILVGHSAGGLSVTYIINKLPEKVEAAVYVAANMLQHGFCSEEDREAALPEYHPGESFEKRGYNMSPQEDVVLASMLLRPPPPSPVFLEARFYGDEEKVGSVRRVFVKTLSDHVIKPEQQDTMMKLWPPSEVFALQSDHSPFFCVPDQLCDLLLNL